MFGEHWPVSIRDEEFIAAFVAATKRKTGGKKEKTKVTSMERYN